MEALRREAQESAAFDLRPFDADDTAFLFKSWLDAYRYSDFGKALDSRTYYDGHHAVIERILERPATRIIVACLPDSPHVDLGYAVAEDDTLHFVFVKRNARQFGVASALLAALDLPPSPRLSHVTGDWFRCFRSRFPASRWNPYLLG
jgi:hypothetical protein